MNNPNTTSGMDSREECELVRNNIIATFTSSNGIVSYFIDWYNKGLSAKQGLLSERDAMRAKLMVVTDQRDELLEALELVVSRGTMAYRGCYECATLYQESPPRCGDGCWFMACVHAISKLEGEEK